MQDVKRFLVSIILLGGILWGCSAGEDSTAVSTQSSEGVISTAKAYAEMTLQVTEQTSAPTSLTLSPTAPIETPISIPTSTPESPIATANQDANVRSGPSEEYPVIDLLFAGVSAEIDGRYENVLYDPSTWWRIHRVGEGKDGWVWTGVLSVSGNIDDVPILIPPPLP
jgi:SH3-like domain-containing protein